MTRRLFVAACFAVVYLVAAPVNAGQLDPGLEDILISTPDGEFVSALVFLADQVDLQAVTLEMNGKNATLRERHETVVLALQDMAASAQGDILAYLDNLKAEGRLEEYRAFWIRNIIEVRGSTGAIKSIADHPDVATVYFNYEIELIDPVETKDDDSEIITVVETGVEAVRAPEVWAMGYTGAGVLVANMDTGVDGNHPALASRWAGVADSRYAGHPEWAWYDPYYGLNDFPYDNNGHGTHTMGSVCGGAPGDEIGVAPGALWIASAPIDRGGGIARTVADAILSFQWMLDPDGDPGTNWDVPDVCSNSWGLVTGHGYAPCDETFWSYLDACEAAGTVIIFSAGNEGTSGLRRPADRATDDYRTFAVAAVDANNPSWPIASFSSRGPTYCTPGGGAAIKPDIAAPGVSVRSSYPGGGYVYFSGTSMASPHVNGVVALIREANPNLSVQEVKQIIFDTAYDLGSAGEDNSYGWGMIDAFEAVNLALQGAGPTADFSGSPTTGCAPLTVNFTDQSSGEITEWSWDFGDGGSSSLQNPSHTYLNAGSYTVSLTVTGPSGSDTNTKPDYISVFDVPVADFSGSPTSGDAPLTVDFTDLSSGNPTAWNWDFGEAGGTSNLQNPSHTYTTPGLKTVSLTASNSCGSDAETKVDYINVTEPTVMEVHIAAISMDRLPDRRKWYGVAYVTVVDQLNQPVAGATVIGFFNAPNTRPREAVTAADGVAEVNSKSTPKPPQDWCFEVTDVVAAGYTYNSADNVVTRACESGPVFKGELPIADQLPNRPGMSQSFPNPFNAQTMIAYDLSEASEVTIEIFDVLGQKVTTLIHEFQQAGYHQVTWNAESQPSGMYFYRIEVDSFVETKRMLLLK
jgi:serine protease AprX